MQGQIPYRTATEGERDREETDRQTKGGDRHARTNTVLVSNRGREKERERDR